MLGTAYKEYRPVVEIKKLLHAAPRLSPKARAVEIYDAVRLYAGAGSLLGVGIFLAGIPIFRLGRRATARNRATRCGVEGP
jgi:hypothetical protein